MDVPLVVAKVESAMAPTKTIDPSPGAGALARLDVTEVVVPELSPIDPVGVEVELLDSWITSKVTTSLTEANPRLTLTWAVPAAPFPLALQAKSSPEPSSVPE